MKQTQDEKRMSECLRLAVLGRGYVSPNPLVGAVLVKRGRIVARGYHEFFGGPHAEVNCLSHWKGSLRGTTLYVNLEPCAHQGKTPPCTELIIRRGIRRVVVGMVDPNPLVRGSGIRKLRQSGVEVTVGVLEEECRGINRMFIRHVTARRPYVHLKIAQSADGRIAGPPGGDRWITSLPSRRLVHEWRGTHDAVLVGARTVKADDPDLTVRLSEGRDPDVVILDGRLRVPESSKVFRNVSSRRVLIATSMEALMNSEAKAARLTARGVTVLPFTGHGGRLVVGDVLKGLYAHRIGSLLVEGGADVFSQFIEEGLFDELSVFVAPKHLGSGLRPLTPEVRPAARGRSLRINRITSNESGDDLLVQAFVDV